MVVRVPDSADDLVVENNVVGDPVGAAAKSVLRWADQAGRIVADAMDAGLRALASTPLSALEAQNQARAMRDPIYAHFRSQPSLEFDEMLHEFRIYEWAARHPWWERPLILMASDPVSRSYSAVKWAWQRTSRGWDDRATWSLDTHLSRTLGEQLIHLARTGHGWPGNEEFPTPEEWESTLLKHGQALLLYADRWSLEADVPFDEADEAIAQAAEGAQEALRWVADHLAHLWD